MDWCFLKTTERNDTFLRYIYLGPWMEDNFMEITGHLLPLTLNLARYGALAALWRGRPLVRSISMTRASGLEGK